MIGTCNTYTYRSASGLCDISAWGYLPVDNTKIKGIVQIAHGMAEHHKRYEDFISYLNDNGYAVFINDHLGHGKSVSDDSQLGFFGTENGWKNLVDDVKSLTEIEKNVVPDVPVILFGHSMGSFVARLYSSMYGDLINGAIYCGTAGANPAAGIGLTVVKSIIRLKGTHHRSKLINSLAFGAYNSKIKSARTAFDWLTRDDDIVDKYIEDDYCGFLFTASGYKDLMQMIVNINNPEWFSSVRADLPIYLVAGDADPVGNYGKGIKEVYHNLVSTGHSDVTIKLFADDRHEILNEKDKNDVYRSILSWINAIVE